MDGIGWEMASQLVCDSDFHVYRRVLLHAANLGHGVDGFTSFPKEGMLWILSPEKSDGFEPAILGTRGQHANRQTAKAYKYVGDSNENLKCLLIY
jgi:hypothetical protein